MMTRLSSHSPRLLVFALMLLPAQRLMAESARRTEPAAQSRSSSLMLESNCNPSSPGFKPYWETDAGTLLAKLLTGPFPSGVTILDATLQPVPAGIDEDDLVGYYEDFFLSDGSATLSIPDGIVFTTGAFTVDGNHAEHCNDDIAFAAALNGSGDANVRNLYSSPPDVYDGVSLSIDFTNTAAVGRLRFKVLLASDEFPYYAEPNPVPRYNQGTICNYPDTFGAFLNDDPIAFTKDASNNEILINVAPRVIKYNNNTAENQQWGLLNSCLQGGLGSLNAQDYVNVDFNIEYDGLSDVMTVEVPIGPSDPEEPHTLKLALTDVKDEWYDTAVFISGLSFLPACNDPPQDSDGDNDVDGTDYGFFSACQNGSGNSVAWDCLCFDSDGDDDVDGADYGVFAACFNGSGNPPNCGGTESLAKMSEESLFETLKKPDTAAFRLASESDGKSVAAGTPVDWSVGVEVTGENQGLAAYELDISLHTGTASGPAVNTILVPPTFAESFYVDGKDATLAALIDAYPAGGPFLAGVASAGNNAKPGRIKGLSAGYDMPWTYTTAASRMTWGVGLEDRKADLLGDEDADYVLYAGLLDTTGLAPGQYVLVLTPKRASVLRSDLDFEEDVDRNFMVPAAVSEPAVIEFEIEE